MIPYSNLNNRVKMVRQYYRRTEKIKERKKNYANDDDDRVCKRTVKIITSFLYPINICMSFILYITLTKKISIKYLHSKVHKASITSGRKITIECMDDRLKIIFFFEITKMLP